MRFARKTGALRRLAPLFCTLAVAALAAAPAAADELALTVLSNNRADLVSNGDALIEVLIPPDVAAADVHVTLNDVDVTSSFGLDASGRFLGLVDGMVIGDNVVEAHVTPPTTKQELPVFGVVNVHVLPSSAFGW